ncbi:MAG: hypothetical protein WA672_08360 [Candidatus Angelobacter sp.]
MTSSGKKPKPLKPSEVKEVILEALGNEGSYREQHLSLHARFDHPERHIDLNDVLFGLKRQWASCKVDGFDEDNWQWKYKIKTQDIEGREFTIVLALEPAVKKFTVITRWPDD